MPVQKPEATTDWIGGAWLASTYGLELVMPLRVISRVGGRRSTTGADGITTETFVAAMRPAPTWRGHLTFHLKHEVPHLELLARLFEQLDGNGVADWVTAEPTGQYARRAGFLYEFLTGRHLDISVALGGAYVDAIDSRQVVAASTGREVPDRRWRVRNNLPGTHAYCPLVRKTPEVLRAMALDVPALLHGLAVEFGEETLLRSAVWMTLRESKSSFTLEGEGDQADRIQRFADVLARRAGQGDWPLNGAALASLQAEILGQRTSLASFGIRQSPVFVGEVVRFHPVVHYVAPPADELAAMLEGLRTFLERTKGQSPIIRGAVAAFGFVYLHPLADGNGRLHRFLINDLLRRDGAIPEPMVLPVSATISRNSAQRRAYDAILDDISRPIMHALAGRYEFTAQPTCYPDGISSNFVCQGAEAVLPAWRLPDLSRHVIYLAQLLQLTIREDMREESRYLRNHDRARRAIKEIIEMPDHQIDRVIRSAQVNHGQLSRVLTEEIPALVTPGIWELIRKAIQEAYQEAFQEDWISHDCNHGHP